MIQKIRQLYNPIQPTVNQSKKNVSYNEYLPRPKLQEFIYCYWHLKTKSPLLEQFNYKVVADGCIDIFFALNDPNENFVMGFCKKYTEFSLDNHFNYVGIRFLPTMFSQIFKIDASLLSNKAEGLEGVLPKTSKFIASHFNEGLTTEQITSTLDKYLGNLISQINFDEDYRLYKAMDIILSNYGVLDVKRDLDVGISARQLQRLFNYYIGDTPKTFGKVVQFQNILRAKPSSQSLRQNKLFYDIGYYDQSHFIKDFKNFYGVTPTKAFKR